VVNQKAAGNFTVDVLTLLGASGTSLELLRQLVPIELKHGDKNLLDEIIVTVFVAKFLAIKHPGQKSQWDLVVQKAWAWVKKEARKIGGDGVNINWETVGGQVMAAKV